MQTLPHCKQSHGSVNGCKPGPLLLRLTCPGLESISVPYLIPPGRGPNGLHQPHKGTAAPWTGWWVELPVNTSCEDDCSCLKSCPFVLPPHNKNCCFVLHICTRTVQTCIPVYSACLYRRTKLNNQKYLRNS